MQPLTFLSEHDAVIEKDFNLVSRLMAVPIYGVAPHLADHIKACPINETQPPDLMLKLHPSVAIDFETTIARRISSISIL